MSNLDADDLGQGAASQLVIADGESPPLPPRPRLSFRCPAELEGVIPRPIPAAQGLPEWLRSMPAEAFSALVDGPDDTVKRCPPFIDAMSEGVLLPLVCDLHVRDGEFTWDGEMPAGRSLVYPRGPISLHDPAQTEGTPFFDRNAYTIKFHNLWTVAAPEGWAILFTHPANRADLPFTTLTGLVDCDRYQSGFIHFPAVWRDPGFCGTLPAGTPIAQAFPVRRERFILDIGPMDEDQTRSAHDLAAEMARDRGVYRRRFRL